MTNINIQQGKVRIDESKKPRFNGDYRETVRFATPFDGLPHILTSVTHLDTTSFVRKFPYKIIGTGDEKMEYMDTVLRYDCAIENVTSTGFRIHVKTWGQNIIYAVDVAWIAIGEGVEA